MHLFAFSPACNQHSKIVQSQRTVKMMSYSVSDTQCNRQLAPAFSIVAVFVIENKKKWRKHRRRSVRVTPSLPQRQAKGTLCRELKGGGVHFRNLSWLFYDPVSHV